MTNTFFPYGRRFILFVFLCLLFSCNNEAEKNTKPVLSSGINWSIIPLPELSQQPVLLRVAKVTNPRFKQLSDKQILKILNRSQQMVKHYFKIDIVFSAVDALSIEAVFKTLKTQVVNDRKSEIVDIDFIDKQIREKMQEALFETLSNYNANKSKVIEYAQPYLLRPEIKHKGFIDFSYALTDTLINRLAYWKTQTAADGKAVLDSSAYNQWVWWDSLGYGDMPYDILITNQLVVSAETYGMDVHSSIRGGITAGTTTYNKNTKHKSYAYIMVYPMINDTALLATLRQDEHYSNEQIIEYSAALLTHEIGHMLLHLGHPFGNSSCIMSPTVMLNYRNWVENLDVDKCPIGSSIAMTPGVVKLEYNRSW